MPAFNSNTVAFSTDITTVGLTYLRCLELIIQSITALTISQFFQLQR